jgi:hypothetical protein
MTERSRLEYRIMVVEDSILEIQTALETTTDKKVRDLYMLDWAEHTDELEHLYNDLDELIMMEAK